jgi:hypothetical protein
MTRPFQGTLKPENPKTEQVRARVDHYEWSLIEQERKRLAQERPGTTVSLADALRSLIHMGSDFVRARSA